MTRLASIIPLVLIAAIAVAEDDAATDLATDLAAEVVGTWHVVSFLDDDAEKIRASAASTAMRAVRSFRHRS